MKASIHLRFYLSSFVLVIISGIIGIMLVEDISFADAFYYSIVTVSTVGYGDIHPQSGWGKMIAVLLIVFGTGTFLGVIANITEIFLNRRDKQSRNQKLNMVRGLFMSELGRELIRECISNDNSIGEVSGKLYISNKWDDKSYNAAFEVLKKHSYHVNHKSIDFKRIRDLLYEKKEFIIRLLENPAVQEHERFTDLLRSSFHLYEEYAYRFDIESDLEEEDYEHLAGDINRIYVNLLMEWVAYMKYIQLDYPYLFTHACKINPFLNVY